MRFLLYAIALFLLPAAASAQGTDPVERVYVQLGSATRVPGTTLQAGTYIFMPGRLVAGQIIIDIYTDKGALVATCLAIQSVSLVRASLNNMPSGPDRNAGTSYIRAP